MDWIVHVGKDLGVDTQGAMVCSAIPARMLLKTCGFVAEQILRPSPLSPRPGAVALGLPWNLACSRNERGIGVHGLHEPPRAGVRSLTGCFWQSVCMRVSPPVLRCLTAHVKCVRCGETCDVRWPATAS